MKSLLLIFLGGGTGKNIPPALYHIEQEGLKLHLSY